MRHLTGLRVVQLALITAMLAGCGPAEDEAVPSGPPAGSVCTLPADANAPHSEWAACARISAELTRPPARGETVTLTVAVTSAIDTVARMEIDLPGSFAWATAPAGLAVTDHPDPDPAGTGCVHRAAASVTLSSGETVRLTGAVTATSAGFATLRARAVLPGGGDGSGSGSVFVTVGETPEDSFFGYRPATGDGDAVRPSPGRPAGCPR
jgi:hypothetical protein